MTDNEIIAKLQHNLKLGDSPIGKGFGTIIDKQLLADTIALIRRQQAEIKVLKMDKEQLESDISNALGNLDHMTQLYEGAIKEFADKLKKEIEQAIDTYYNHAAGGYYLAEDCIDEIDNLVKEMGC